MLYLTVVLPLCCVFTNSEVGHTLYNVSLVFYPSTLPAHNRWHTSFLEHLQGKKDKEG
jgi:hypothetical protein